MASNLHAASAMGTFMARQGDILIVEIRKLPAGAHTVPREGSSIVIAHGEATGHRHRITSPHAALYERGDERFLVVEQPVELRHEEHAAIAFAPGVYRIVRQREYVPGAVARWVDD